MREKWSDNLRELTRDVLFNMPFESFMFKGRCHLKHTDGRFGYITLADASEENYRIHLSDSDEVEDFDTIDLLVEAGWAVD